LDGFPHPRVTIMERGWRDNGLNAPFSGGNEPEGWRENS